VGGVVIKGVFEENGRVVNQKKHNESIRPFVRLRTGKLRTGLWGFFKRPTVRIP